MHLHFTLEQVNPDYTKYLIKSTDDNATVGSIKLRTFPLPDTTIRGTKWQLDSYGPDVFHRFEWKTEGFFDSLLDAIDLMESLATEHLTYN